MRNVCEIDGCTNQVVSVGNRKDSAGKLTTRYCDKHYARIKAHGSAEDNQRTHGTLEERFLRKVQKGEGCWLWGGSVDGGGYGQIKAGGKFSSSYRAHRVSYQIHKGEIPEGFVVMHGCDNKLCVNPAHLQLGTTQENVTDCVLKGRRAVNVSPMRGEKNGRSKLTAEDVRMIRQSDIPASIEAKTYGVTDVVIRRIRKRQSWKHVE